MESKLNLAMRPWYEKKKIFKINDIRLIVPHNEESFRNILWNKCFSDYKSSFIHVLYFDSIQWATNEKIVVLLQMGLHFGIELKIF